MPKIRPIIFASLLTTAVGCGGGDDTCNVATNDGCDDGFSCELVQDGEPTCFAPFVVAGNVFDIDDSAAVEGAHVVALDINGSPRSSVAVTDVDGNYELIVPALRDAEGGILDDDITLRVDAQSYVTFPSGVRVAQPISIESAALSDDRWVLMTAQTQVGLYPLADAPTGSISGDVTRTDDAPFGALVVAEVDGVGHAAIADRDGSYTIFNLPAGDYDVNAYSRGLNYTAVAITLGDGDSAVVDLDLSGDAASSVSGSVILTQGAPPATSVILAVASTFDADALRGESPPGMRAPEPLVAPDVSGPWTITGVPAGRYVVLASFENDGGVRELSGNGGTALVYVDVVAATDLPDAGEFKVTAAVPMIGPGADGLEVVTAAPDLQWAKDPQASSYQVRVVDALGEVLMDEFVTDTSPNEYSVPYSGTLTEGMFYQVRIFSWDELPPLPDGAAIRAASEDLKGVFVYQP
jgi:hypothetical protein